MKLSMEREPFARVRRGVVVAAVLALAGFLAPAAAAPPAADQQCLMCHGMAGLTKKTADGDSISLQIPADAFAQSVHAPLGCTTCHSDVNMKSHPPAQNVIPSRREFSIARAQVCATCHTAQAAEWQKSVHAALARAGDKAAPICTSCHSPHTVRKGVAETLDTVPCKACHGAIFNAYASSMHGQALKAGVTAAPLCFSCHGAHGVQVPTTGQDVVEPACLNCHKEALANHQAWLPDAALHFQVVSCPACHAPTAQRKVELVLYNNKTQTQAPEPVGVPEFLNSAGLAVATGKGIDASTLAALLGVLNHQDDGGTILRGRLTVRTGVEAHELAAAGAAISTCNTCHSAGSPAFQSVSISVAGTGGIPKYYDVSQQALSSAVSIASIGGFYAIGGMRMSILDDLLLFVLFVGIALPIVHVTARVIFKRLLKGAQDKQDKG